MIRAKISELKNELSRYLRYVRRGEAVLVYDRDRPVARIEPVRSSVSGELDDWTEGLERVRASGPLVHRRPSDGSLDVDTG